MVCIEGSQSKTRISSTGYSSTSSTPSIKNWSFESLATKSPSHFMNYLLCPNVQRDELAVEISTIPSTFLTELNVKKASNCSKRAKRFNFLGKRSQKWYTYEYINIYFCYSQTTNYDVLNITRLYQKNLEGKTTKSFTSTLRWAWLWLVQEVLLHIKRERRYR